MGHSIETQAYWTERDAQITADMAADAAFAASDTGRLLAARRRLNLVTGENGYLHTDAERDAAFAAVAEIEARRRTGQAGAAARWTRDVTIARRAAWNAALQNPAYRTTTGKSVLVGKIVSALGFTAEELKTAVARHGL